MNYINIYFIIGLISSYISLIYLMLYSKKNKIKVNDKYIIICAILIFIFWPFIWVIIFFDWINNKIRF